MHFTDWKQFLTLLSAQISGKDSLREIETALLANHAALSSRYEISRNTVL